MAAWRTASKEAASIHCVIEGSASRTDDQQFSKGNRTVMDFRWAGDASFLPIGPRQPVEARRLILSKINTLD
jgi:hypothetical protein